MEELTEEVFIKRARTFFYEVAGVESASLDADANLVESGILDSLLLISFLAFIEKLRGVHALNAALSAITAAVVGVVLNSRPGR